MEARILECLDFKLSLPTPLTFFQLFSTYYDMNSKTISLCSYIVELTLIDSFYLKYKGSLIGLAAIYLAFKILGLDDWNDVRTVNYIAYYRVDSGETGRREIMCSITV